MAKTLTSAMAVRDFDLAAHPDKYKENLRKLVEAKVQGEEVFAPPPEEARQR